MITSQEETSPRVPSHYCILLGALLVHTVNVTNCTVLVTKSLTVFITASHLPLSQAR